MTEKRSQLREKNEWMEEPAKDMGEVRRKREREEGEESRRRRKKREGRTKGK